MSSQRYQRVSPGNRPVDGPLSLHTQSYSHNSLQVAEHDEDASSPIMATSNTHQDIPSSPPPSFRSRASSRRNSAQHDETEAERSLEDAFAGPEDDESDDEDHSDSRRLVRSSDRTSEDVPAPGNVQRRVTDIPTFPASGSTGGRVYGGGNGTRDGVFANISAKPRPGEELEEKPPVCTPYLRIQVIH